MPTINEQHYGPLIFLQIDLASMLKDDLSSLERFQSSYNVKLAIQDAKEAIAKPGLLEGEEKAFIEMLLEDLKESHETLTEMDPDDDEWVDNGVDEKRAIENLEASIKNIYLPKIQETVFSKKTLPAPASRPMCTLAEFIEKHCELSNGDTIDSKVQLLYKIHRKEKITLPEMAAKWKPGKAKVFYEDDLKRLWSGYTEEIPSLYKLKTSPAEE